MKQLEVVVSPPAFVWDPYLTLTHVTFDLDICELWPLGHISNVLCKILNNTFLHVDLDLWPKTLTFYREPCDLWPWPLWPLASMQQVKCTLESLWKSRFFYLMTSTFDLWPWPSHMTKIKLTFITILNLVTLSQTVPSRDMNFFLVILV